MVTFLYGQHYECNEYCKYYKNVESAGYKFIPAVHRTCYDDGTTPRHRHREHQPRGVRGDAADVRRRVAARALPDAAASMDRFIDKVKDETNGELVGDLEVTRIPLDVYHAWHNTTRRWHESGLDHPLARTPVFLLGDSAIGSPYFQSISLGFESAFYLAGHLANRALPMPEIFERYEKFMYQQWLRVYMRSQMIKHNKDLLQVVDDVDGLLAKLHIY